MGSVQRLVRFGKGGLIGAGIGSAMALFLAPASGDGLRHQLRTRLARAKLAGYEAQEATIQNLSRKFRESVNDPAALAAAETSARQKVDQYAASLRALEANAPTVEPSGRRPGGAS